MPYLDEAARQLGISEKTLRRWLRVVEPPIAPTPHKYDRRYQIITEQDVEVIRAARSELPGSKTLRDISNISIDSKLDGRRSESDKLPYRDTSPARPTAATPLPDGLVSLTAAAELHEVGRYLSTFRRWRDQGKLEHEDRTYGGVHGQFPVNRPLTQRGLAQFYRLASRYPEFYPCPNCPHELQGLPVVAASDPEDAITTPTSRQE